MIDNNNLSFSVDDFVESLLSLQKTEQKSERMELATAQKSGKFVRADVGMFRNKDDHSIWKLEKDDTGIDFIVRSDEFDVPQRSEWTATANREGSSVTLAYKKYPICCFASSEFKFKDADDFAKFLVEKASGEQKPFALAVMKTLPFEQRVALQKKFAIFREG